VTSLNLQFVNQRGVETDPGITEAVLVLAKQLKFRLAAGLSKRADGSDPDQAVGGCAQRSIKMAEGRYPPLA
jgi:hypothetical protein